ncbi:MAG: hypothetical protein DRQ37_05225 [Gammaproteobacteria bacterium]|nr:MAG: hypothetical protein DRQ37_05225 [Gammaproteobacteria bacterium]
MQASDAPRSERASELSRVLALCNQRLQTAALASTSPVLRLEGGAGLIQGPRAQQVADLLAPMLALAAPCLYVPPARSVVANLTIRPKLRVTLRLGGAGLLAQIRYFGEAPADADLRTLYAPQPSSAARVVTPGYALAAFNKDGIVADSQQQQPTLPAAVRALTVTPPLAADALAHGEICLRAVWHEPARRWPVVRVMAGRREVAVPMFSVEQVVSEDVISGDLPPTHSLAMCLGEESSPSPLGRPALLMLRRRGPQLALRVEALLGHGNEVVHPAGLLLQSAPWILGVIGNNDVGTPMLVVDPLALPGLPAASPHIARDRRRVCV